MKRIIITLSLFIVIGIVKKAHSQTNSEFGYMVLSTIVETPVEINGDNFLQLLVTIPVTFEKKIVYIEDNKENKSILSMYKSFFIDSKVRVYKKGDWVDPISAKDSSNAYELVYAYGQKLYSQINSFQEFGHVGLDNLVKRIVCPYKGLFRKSVAGQMYQILVTGPTAGGDDTSGIIFSKKIAYISITEKNNSIFNQNELFLVDIKLMSRKNNNWVEPKYSNKYWLIYNYGYSMRMKDTQKVEKIFPKETPPVKIRSWDKK